MALLLVTRPLNGARDTHTFWDILLHVYPGGTDAIRDRPRPRGVEKSPTDDRSESRPERRTARGPAVARDIRQGRVAMVCTQPTSSAAKLRPSSAAHSARLPRPATTSASMHSKPSAGSKHVRPGLVAETERTVAVREGCGVVGRDQGEDAPPRRDALLRHSVEQCGVLRLVRGQLLLQRAGAVCAVGLAAGYSGWESCYASLVV